MAFIPVSNTAQLDLVYLYSGQLAVNTMYFFMDAAWTPTTLQDLIEAVDAWHNSFIKTLQPSAAILQAINARDLTSINGIVANYTTGLPRAGTATCTQILPNNVALSVAFRTGLAGRSFRGRNFWIGICSNWLQTANTITSAAAAQIISAYDALDAALPTAAYQHVVVSRYTNGEPRLNGVRTPVIQYTINPTFDSMRRRLPERGA